MQAVRGHYKMGQVQLLEPLLNVTEADVCVIILDHAAPQQDEDSVSHLKVQSMSHFAQNVLLDPAEDVWNDL